MITILIVDDSAVERRLAGGLLQASPDFELQYAEHGKEALQLIAHNPPHVVVTDLVMPEMDGLELVRAVRESYPQVPVILMTAYGNEEIAAQSLRDGAASYVPKSLRAATLLHTVRQVLERARAVQETHRLSQCLDHVECSYVLENDPALIKTLVDGVETVLAGVGLTDETGQVQVGVALEEALLNALYHGNLSVDGTSYSEARLSGDSNQLEALRRADPPYCDRRITFKMNISQKGAQFVVRDEGNGFPGVVLLLTNEPPDAFETGKHRGLSLMRYLMDDVQYNEMGNEVKMSVRKRASAEDATQ